MRLCRDAARMAQAMALGRSRDTGNSGEDGFGARRQGCVHRVIRHDKARLENGKFNQGWLNALGSNITKVVQWTVAFVITLAWYHGALGKQRFPFGRIAPCAVLCND